MVEAARSAVEDHTAWVQPAVAPHECVNLFPEEFSYMVFKDVVLSGPLAIQVYRRAFIGPARSEHCVFV